MLILKKEDEAEVSRAIESIRSKYPLPKYAIQYGASHIRMKMLTRARDVFVKDLRDGSRYLELYFSPDATAFDGNRNQLPKHGDIYLTIWQWDAARNVFWCKNAWGGIVERKPSVMNGPLIEWEEAS